LTIPSPGRSRRPTALIFSFGPVDAKSDGYLTRVDFNARALEALGLDVVISEISKRHGPAALSRRIRVIPAWPRMTPPPGVLGTVDLFGTVRKQLAIIVGFSRNWSAVKSASLVVIEGGLFAICALLIRLLIRSRDRPVVVFDVLTVMSALHRHQTVGGSARDICTVACRGRRLIWTVLEFVCSRSTDMTAICSQLDRPYFPHRRVAVVPNGVESDFYDSTAAEDPKLLAFVGSGRLAPNREALGFLVGSVLTWPEFSELRCRVIGEPTGYPSAWSQVEFLGFRGNLSQALDDVSVCCAPMRETGGVSTKVLTTLANGKRTVCTPEGARGIELPPIGLWVAERDQFGVALASALMCPWGPAESHVVREWIFARHGLSAIVDSWRGIVHLQSTDKPDSIKTGNAPDRGLV